jgi:hypothetical protein
MNNLVLTCNANGNEKIRNRSTSKYVVLCLYIKGGYQLQVHKFEPLNYVYLQ